MSLCNKEGIRIYPIVEYGKYKIEVEFNQTQEFLPRNIIRTKQGEGRYDVNGNDWFMKILELYEHLYETRIKKRKAALS